jgi:hypothetical protein
VCFALEGKGIAWVEKMRREAPKNRMVSGAKYKLLGTRRHLTKPQSPRIARWSPKTTLRL